MFRICPPSAQPGMAGPQASLGGGGGGVHRPGMVQSSTSSLISGSKTSIPVGTSDSTSLFCFLAFLAYPLVEWCWNFTQFTKP